MLLPTIVILTVLSLFGWPTGGQDESASMGPRTVALNLPPLTAPKTGALLVASRDMPDSRFQRTVILLLEHNEEGTLGLIINRPTEFKLPDILSNLEGAAAGLSLFFGGPVAVYEPLLLMRGKPDSARLNHVIGDVYWGNGRLALEWLLGRAQPFDALRVYLGHAGWAPGQLHAELAAGGWELFEAAPEIVFRQDLDTLWQELMERPRWIMTQQAEPTEVRRHSRQALGMNRLEEESGIDNAR